MPPLCGLFSFIVPTKVGISYYTRKEEGLPLLTEEEWPSATTALTKTFFADHAISKIIESYNSGKILKEGLSAWY